MPKKIGKYILCDDKLLGQGAVAKVYLAYVHDNKQQIYAIKVVDKKKFQEDVYLKNAVKREFENQSKLKHKHVVQFIEWIETNNNIYFVQEYCDSQTLREFIKFKNKLSEKQTIAIMKQFCHGYSQLIRKGVIHRDLKPENLFISGGLLKIGDFGYSKEINTQKQMLTSIVGSPIYMAPQILKGEKYSSKCDVWSFGVMIYEMIYGKFPWDAKNVTSLLKKVLTQPLFFPQQPPLKQQLHDFIQDCLKQKQEQRMSWIQIFQHKIFKGQFLQLANQIRKDFVIAANLLNQLACQVKPSILIGCFLQFRVKALDLKLFKKVISWLIPDATESQLNIMYEMFDKDCNGVIDVYQFVKAFQICEEEVLLLLNFLIEHQNMMYEQLLNGREVRRIAQKENYSSQAVYQLTQIINSIILSK